MRRPPKLLFMCDYEELDLEDFQLMLAAISKASRPQTGEAPIRAPLQQLVVARQRSKRAGMPSAPVIFWLTKETADAP